METAGTGQVVVSGFGSMFQLDVEPGKDVVIDNSHVVCWDNSLKYEISVTTGGGSGGGGIGGFLGNIVNSVTSGEGIVLLPRFMLEGGLASGRVQQILPDWIPPELWFTLYYPPYDRLPVRLTQFSDFVADYVTRVRPLG